MARRGKTVIGKGEKEQTRLMMQAEESGVAARGRASEALVRQQQAGIQQGMQMGRLGAETAQQHAQLEQQRKIATGQEMQAGQRIELQEAQAGMERAPGGAEPPLSREERLRQEMDQGTAGAEAPETSPMSPEEVARLQRQGEQPIEIGGAGPAQPGLQEPGGLRQSEAGKKRQELAQYEADTKRMTAQARITATQNKVMQAEAKGDKEARKIIRAEKISALDQQKDLYSRIKNNKPSATDFRTLTKWAEESGMADSPGGEQLMEILAAGSKSGMGPVDPEGQFRLQSFIKAHMDRSGMKFAALFGEVPGDFVDFSGPVMEQYMGAQKQVTSTMQQLGPSFQNYYGIKTWEDKLRFQNRMAAILVLSGSAAGFGGGAGGGAEAGGAIATAGGAPSADPTGGMPPGGGMQPSAAQPSGVGGGVGVGGQQFGGGLGVGAPEQQQVSQMPPVSRPAGPPPISKPTKR